MDINIFKGMAYFQVRLLLVSGRVSNTLLPSWEISARRCNNAPTSSLPTLPVRPQDLVAPFILIPGS